VADSSSGTSFGRYRLLGVLGRGGMGEVFRAYDTETDRVVALKVLPPQMAEDREFQRRFRREARTAAGLNDPHVVPIHNYGEIDGRLYVDMRLVEGRDLHTLIENEGGRLSAARTVAIIEQVAAALDSAHQVGLVHRDVKPSNILTTGRDFAYLIDFGIARANTDTSMTKTGHMVGTLAYMAPERFSGTTDPRADVYALACVLHECLTGDRPYPGDSLEQQIAGHLNAPLPRPSTSYPDIPSAFDEVIARGMAKDPDNRYQTASELADAARAALTSPLGGSPSSPPAQAATQRAPQPRRSSAAAKSPPAKKTLRPPQAKSVSPNEQRRATAKRKLEEEMELRAKQTRRRAVIIGGTVAAVAVVVAIVAILIFGAHDQTTNTAATTTNSASPATTTANSAYPATTTAPAPGAVPALPPFQAPAGVGANCQYPTSQDAAAKPVKPPRTGKIPTDPATVSVSMATSQGNIGLLLANNESPCTVNSFASLAGQKFFNITKCHRLTTSADLSVLQCGDPKGDGRGPGYQFANEYPTDQYPSNDPKLKQAVLYPRGTVAMANAGADTNGSQFFLVYKDSQLPPQYTVFGKIQDFGLATLDMIAKGGVAGGGEDGTPATEVWINSVVLD
jgi:eukaryotic-like serine/threonine-protein kinase